MTRKDYELIARIFNAGPDETLPNGLEHTDFIKGMYAARNAYANCMADALAVDNPRFNRGKFLEACGMKN